MPKNGKRISYQFCRIARLTALYFRFSTSHDVEALRQRCDGFTGLEGVRKSARHFSRAPESARFEGVAHAHPCTALGCRSIFRSVSPVGAAGLFLQSSYVAGSYAARASGPLTN